MGTEQPPFPRLIFLLAFSKAGRSTGSRKVKSLPPPPSVAPPEVTLTKGVMGVMTVTSKPVASSGVGGKGSGTQVMSSESPPPAPSPSQSEVVFAGVGGEVTGACVGDGEEIAEGVTGVGLPTGEAVGSSVGVKEGAVVGEREGAADGVNEGMAVGDKVAAAGHGIVS